MPGKKNRSQYKRKKKGRAFTGIQRHAKKLKKTASIGTDSEIPGPAPVVSTPEADRPISSSRSKMMLSESFNDSSSDFDDDFKGDSVAYRLIDLNNLSSSLSEAHVCEEGEKYFETS